MLKKLQGIIQYLGQHPTPTEEASAQLLRKTRIQVMILLQMSLNG